LVRGLAESEPYLTRPTMNDLIRRGVRGRSSVPPSGGV
jgi:hypothetical protein